MSRKIHGIIKKLLAKFGILSGSTGLISATILEGMLVKNSLNRSAIRLGSETRLSLIFRLRISEVFALSLLIAVLMYKSVTITLTDVYFS